MIKREKILEVLESYKPKKLTIGCIGSHSALDICDGAKDEGFETFVFCEEGREEPYTRYFRSRYANKKLVSGCVDQAIVLKKFDEMLDEKWQDYMQEKNLLFIPNRSFVVYVGNEPIAEKFYVPLVGSRGMLGMEERGEGKDYYWLCQKAGIATPKRVESPKQIDSLVMVKLPHAKQRLERGFFTAANYKEFKEKSKRLLKLGVITKEDLKKARIEEYILGPVMNFDFFYSPVNEALGEEGLELLGIDWRFESNLDGLVRLPAGQQLSLREKQRDPLYIVVGHNTCTLRESILRHIFGMGEKFVEASQKHCKPGIIGAFCLQTIITPELKPVVYDVALRIGGGTNVHAYLGHPYGNILWRKRMSSGRRTALEIKRARENELLEEIVT